MEIAMLEHHTTDPELDFRRLSPEQWERRKQWIIQRAHEDRARAVGELARRLGVALRSVAESGRDLAQSLASRLAATAGRWASDYAVWRNRRQAVRELAALDDRVLKDLGIHRSEIELVIYGRDSQQATEGKVTALLFHKPYDRPTTAPKPAKKPSIEKSAA
jgi:uncharacterized protein YjiS (DUF1127 family)